MTHTRRNAPGWDMNTDLLKKLETVSITYQKTAAPRGNRRYW
jgi:hypothetical protein